MFISIEQLEASLQRLKGLHPFFGIAFLAFKRAGLPIGETVIAPQARVCEDILQEYYRPTERFSGFYNPFSSSKGEEGWVNSRYGSTGLQRICTGTFRDAFIHEKNSSEWGWSTDYVAVLKRHLGSNEKINVFDLAIWLYRDHSWPPKTSRKDISNRLLKEFRISELEKKEIFSMAFPAKSIPLQSAPISEIDVLDLIGVPPGANPPGGALLHHLEIRSIGPAGHFTYEPANRLNLVTGDNSLGKTFLLDVIWWALSGEWCNYPAIPRRKVAKSKPRISFEVSTGSRRRTSLEAKFDWAKHSWRTSPQKREAVAGLVVYARHDGSFGIWDPARAEFGRESGTDHVSQIILSPTAVWRGLRRTDATQREQTLCNGMISDWLKWQVGGKRYAPQFEALTSVLAALSPAVEEPIVPGEPYRFPLDSQECPTLRMTYGDVPIILASAGIQRAIGLAYVLVWAWHEHLMYAQSTRQEPQRRLVLMVDEVEAHLHPRWQRTIVPALMKVVDEVSNDVSPQLHIATHSPLVLASAETVFDEQYDSLHHLFLTDHDVRLEEIPFVRYGRVDRWLMSDIFGLGHARSLPAESAIEDAKKIQLRSTPDRATVLEIHERLIRNLADDDEFWPRWLFFAEQQGFEP